MVRAAPLIYPSSLKLAHPPGSNNAGVHVYRLVSREGGGNFCHVNVDLLDCRTINEVHVSHYEGWPGAASTLTDWGGSDAHFRPTPANPHSSAAAAFTGDVSPDTPPRSAPRGAATSPGSRDTSVQQVHSTNILVRRHLRGKPLSHILTFFASISFLQAVQFYGAFADLGERSHPEVVSKQQGAVASHHFLHSSKGEGMSSESSGQAQRPATRTGPQGRSQGRAAVPSLEQLRKLKNISR